MLLDARIYKSNLGEGLIVIEGKLNRDPLIYRRYLAKISYSYSRGVDTCKLCKIPYKFIDSCYIDNTSNIQICRCLERFRVGSHISDIMEFKENFINLVDMDIIYERRKWSLFRISCLRKMLCERI